MWRRQRACEATSIGRVGPSARVAPVALVTLTTGTASRKPLPGLAVVSASCGAVEALARALALELAPIRVNVIAPGLIDTPLHERLMGTRGGAAQAIDSGILNSISVHKFVNCTPHRASAGLAVANDGKP